MGKVSARQVQELYGQDVWEAIIASELMLRGSTESDDRQGHYRYQSQVGKLAIRASLRAFDKGRTLDVSAESSFTRSVALSFV